MAEPEMEELADIIVGAMKSGGDERALALLRARALELCRAFPIPRDPLAVTAVPVS